MVKQGISYAIVALAVLFMRSPDVCEGEVWCPPALDGEDYVFTAEIYDVFNPQMRETVVSELSISQEVAAICFWHNVSCTIQPQFGNLGFDFKRNLFGALNSDLQVTLKIPAGPAVLGIFTIFWIYDGGNLTETCTVSIGAPIDECSTTMPCNNSNSCTDLPVGYQCECLGGYGGHDCDIGDNKLYCDYLDFSIRFVLPSDGPSDTCQDITISCYLAGLNETKGIISDVRLETPVSTQFLVIAPIILDDGVVFNVCISTGITPGKFQLQHEIVGNGVYNFTTNILVTYEPPFFNLSTGQNLYEFNVTEDLQLGDIVTYVNKSKSQTCEAEDGCILVQSFDPDSLSLAFKYGSPSVGSIQLTVENNSLSLGYFFVTMNLVVGDTNRMELTVTDGEGSNSSVEVLFTVTDVNEPPVCDLTTIDIFLDFFAPYPQNVTSVSCVDPDVEDKFREITYTIQGFFSSYFLVYSNGTLQLNSPLSSLAPRVYNFNVEAVGYSDPPNDRDFVFEIPINLIIKAPTPNCTLTISTSPEVWEDLAQVNLTLLCEVFGLNDLQISYSSNDFDVEAFQVIMGEYALRLTLKAYVPDFYTFHVNATLGGDEDILNVTIPVFNPPAFSVNTYSETVTDHIARGTIITTVNAFTDTPQASISYEIVAVSSGASGIFEVNPVTGQVSVASNIPTSLVDSTVSLTVQARDEISNLTDTASVTISIVDVNEKPSCNLTTNPIRIPSNLTTGDIIFTLNCADPDVRQDFKTTFYSIIQISPQTVFLNVSARGEILLAQPLPPRVSTAEVTVLVSDGLDPQLSDTVHEYIYITAVTCPEETTSTGVIFQETQVDTNITVGCPQGYSGLIIRQCYMNKTWGYFTYNNCHRKDLEAATKTISTLLTKPGLTTQEATDGLRDISQLMVASLAKSPTILSGDINQLIEILNGVGELTKADENVTLDESSLNNFINTTDSLLLANDSVWDDSYADESQLEYGAQLIKAVDQMTASTLKNPEGTEGPPIVRESIAIQRAKVLQDIVFPNRTEFDDESYESWVLESKNTVFLSKEALLQVKNPIAYSVIMYRDGERKLRVNPKLQNEALMDKKINSNVLSLTLNVNLSVLSPPLELQFSVKNANYSSPSCAFLETSGRDGVWSSTGCTPEIINDQRVMCRCSHLTNFAVLMNPYGGSLSASDYRALSIISAIGCGISILCLVVTIIIYFILWKYVKCDRSVLHIHLCVCLVLAYIIFLAGVDKTGNEIGCKVIAAFLHYIYLTVFFIMLSEGIELLKSVTFVFSSNSILCKLLPFTYGVPLVVVAISLGVTQTEGYGNEKHCWLSTEKGVIWAFIAPALLVLLINFIILIKVLRIMQNTKTMMDKNAQQRARSVIRTIVILSPVLGITWLFGILSVSEEVVAFQYLFAIFNSLQGLFIFLFYCLLPHQVRDGFRAMKRKQKARSFDSGQRMVQSSDSRGHNSYSDSNTPTRQYKSSNGMSSPVSNRTFDFNPDQAGNFSGITDSSRNFRQYDTTSLSTHSSEGKNRLAPLNGRMGADPGRYAPVIRREGVPLNMAQAYDEFERESSRGGYSGRGDVVRGAMNPGYMDDDGIPAFQAGNANGYLAPPMENDNMSYSQRDPARPRRPGFRASLKEKWQKISRRRNRDRNVSNLEVDQNRVKEIYGEVEAVRPGQFKPAPPPKHNRAKQRWKKVQNLARSPQRFDNINNTSRSPFGTAENSRRPSWTSIGGTFCPPTADTDKAWPDHLTVPEPGVDYDSDV